MLQGQSLDADILPNYERLSLFLVGKDHIYASRFPRKDAHTGCFQKSHFQIEEVTETVEWQPEPPEGMVDIERNKIYKAKLIWCWKNSEKMPGKTYFVITRASRSQFDVYKKEDLKGILACCPVRWFESFQAVDHQKEIENVETVPNSVIEENNFEQPEEPQFFEQIKLF